MGKRRTNNSVTTAPDSRASTGLRSSPSSNNTAAPAEVPTSSPSFLFIVAGFGFLAVFGLIAVIWSNAANIGERSPTTAKSATKRSTWNPKSEDDLVCDQFMMNRRAGDPAAFALLSREPIEPMGVITEDEAERLQTDYFLHAPDLQMVAIRRGTAAGQYVFVTKGNVTAPRLAIRLNDNEISHRQRMMSNPDLHVEVSNGKIYGIRSTLQRD